MFYPFSIKINKCSGNCNNINDLYARICVPDVMKNLNLMSRTNKTRNIKWHESCKCICRLDRIICNNKQKWNKDKCRCEYKKLIDKGVWEKGYKSSKDIDIYYINYIQENLNSSSPLCIKINSPTEQLKKNDEKYLILDSTKEYESVWSEIRSEIKRINGGEKVFYEKNYCKIGINTEDDLPLKESLQFLMLIVNINLVLGVDNKLYPKIYLDECFYEL